MNTADYLLEYGDPYSTALILKSHTYTYGDVRRSAMRLLCRLVREGVKPGERVGLLGENSLFWVAAYLAILKMGALAVPLPVATNPDDLRKKVNFIHCKVVLADRHSLRRLSCAFGPDLRLILDNILDEPEGETWWEPSSSSFDLDLDAALMLTSGTTAQPRLVRITHHNIQANTNSIISYLSLDSTDRILVVLPFYYCFGTSLLHSHLRAGGSLALCNTFMYPETCLEMLEQQNCTGFAGVPYTFQTLLRNSSFPRRQFPDLKKIQQAGGKLPVTFQRELRAAQPHAKLYVMYGQTEATARLSYLPPEMWEQKQGSIGRGIPGVELRVLDETGQPVPPGQVGEIVARGENISPGYVDDPEANAEKFSGGMLRTGDLATVDGEGYIWIVDRKADFIKVTGHRVSSQEVEACILELPEVVSVAAIGEPDDELGEAIKVFLVLRQGASLNRESILVHCGKKLPAYMIPKFIEQVESLPMNAHGKVIKSALRTERTKVLV